MDGRLLWTDCDEAGYYVVPYVLSPRDLVSRPDNMDETVPHTVASSCSEILSILANAIKPNNSIQPVERKEQGIL